MSNEQILEKAVLKAARSGKWNPQHNILKPEIVIDSIVNKTPIPYQVYIFDHDFAKALWGETTDYTAVNMAYPDSPSRVYFYQNGYKYHLQQMVISDDPIKYLGDNI